MRLYLVVPNFDPPANAQYSTSCQLTMDTLKNKTTFHFLPVGLSPFRQKEEKTTLLAKVQLCEYANQTLEAFVEAIRLNAEFDCPVARQNATARDCDTVDCEIVWILCACVRARVRAYACISASVQATRVCSSTNRATCPTLHIPCLPTVHQYHL